jgi:hypothetical protein
MKPQAVITDRRRRARGGTDEPTRDQLVERIVGTFREMPGLCLTPEQAPRLFGIPSTTSQLVLSQLVDKGQLHRTPDGQYRIF